MSLGMTFRAKEDIKRGTYVGLENNMVVRFIGNNFLGIAARSAKAGEDILVIVEGGPFKEINEYA